MEKVALKPNHELMNPEFEGNMLKYTVCNRVRFFDWGNSEYYTHPL